MGGGLLQLVLVGQQDQYITTNPQISYFKYAYKKHTNFSMENISLDMDKTELSFNQQKQFTRKFDRNADLVSKVYLSLTLPEANVTWLKEFSAGFFREVSKPFLTQNPSTHTSGLKAKAVHAVFKTPFQKVNSEWTQPPYAASFLCTVTGPFHFGTTILVINAEKSYAVPV